MADWPTPPWPGADGDEPISPECMRCRRGTCAALPQGAKSDDWRSRGALLTAPVRKLYCAGFDARRASRSCPPERCARAAPRSLPHLPPLHVKAAESAESTSPTKAGSSLFLRLDLQPLPLSTCHRPSAPPSTASPRASRRPPSVSGFPPRRTSLSQRVGARGLSEGVVRTIGSFGGSQDLPRPGCCTLFTPPNQHERAGRARDAGSAGVGRRKSVCLHRHGRKGGSAR